MRYASAKAQVVLTVAPVAICAVVLALAGPVSAGPVVGGGPISTESTTTTTTEVAPGNDHTATTAVDPGLTVAGDLAHKPSLSAGWQPKTMTSPLVRLKKHAEGVKWLKGRLIANRKLASKWAGQLGRSVPPVKRNLLSVQSIPVLKRQVALWKHRAATAHAQFLQVIGNHGYLPPLQARALGRWLAAQKYQWTGKQWACLDTIWGKTKRYGTLESGWDVLADNPHSDAYGIPQALPGHKMSSMGADWARSAFTQIKWGLKYIKGKFHDPCGALSKRLAQGSY